MRRGGPSTRWMFGYVSPEERAPPDYPLRAIRRMTDGVFERLSPRFSGCYATMGRSSIPPEKLLWALLLQGLYTVRSERLLMEQLHYNLLFGRSSDWAWTIRSGTQHHSQKDRDRLLDGDIATAFFAEVLAGQDAGPGAGRHFTVDGTLLEACASQRSFRRNRTASRSLMTISGIRRETQEEQRKSNSTSRRPTGCAVVK